jgi:hypothetical protein
MQTTVNLSKLAELRVKTDRDLVRVIDHELELGLRSNVPAEKARAEALKLLPAVEDLMEWHRLERKLEQLEGAPQRLSRPGRGGSPQMCACAMGQSSRG